MTDQDYEQYDSGNDADAETARLAKLASFAEALTVKRREAMNGRQQSGIEVLWREDTEYYEGVDDANRAESMLKPSTSSGRVTISTKESGSRSNVFVNITQAYVDLASSRVADMALPTDDKPFSIKSTPVPEIEKLVNDQSATQNGSTVGEMSSQFIQQMKDKADKAETKIWDWLCEARWHGEVRKVIEQAAKIGVGVLKGPFPERRKKRKMSHDEYGNIVLNIEEELKPTSKMIDVWNLFPDPSCGESIHNGSYLFERDYISARQLRDLKHSGYIDSEIDAVLKEGPGKKNIDSRNKVVDTDNYEIWYYYGQAGPEDLMSAECRCDKGADWLSVMVVMVNDRIIKASLSILDSGEFPYDVLRWQYIAGMWAGRGVARQVRTSQKIINAASRNMLDNAGISAGPQLILRNGVIHPADGEWTITPMKIWIADESVDSNQVDHSITSIVIPSMQVELQNIINMALEFAERTTSMPIMLQGQQGVGIETATGRQILQNNSNTVQRRIAKIYDDDLIEPHVLRYYEYLMIHGDDDEAKGDFTVVALGSSALYERDAQNQMIMQMVPMSANPAFGLNPDLLMVEILKMNKISLERVRYSDQEREQMKQAAQQNPPQNPALQVAQVRVQGDMEKAKLVQQSDMAELQLKEQIETTSLQLKQQMMQMEHEHQMQLKRIDYEIKMMELAQSQQVSVDSIKAALASDVMRLKTQKELSQASLDHEKDIKAHEHYSKVALQPLTEPVGQAPNGQSFQR